MPSAPSIKADSPIDKANVQWFWNSDGGELYGTGIFQYRLDGGSWSSDTTALSYANASLSNGSHTLEVREKNMEGFYSPSSSKTIIVTDYLYYVYTDKNASVAFSITDGGGVGYVVEDDTDNGTVSFTSQAGGYFNFSYDPANPTPGFSGSDSAKYSLDDGSEVMVLFTVADPTVPTIPDDTEYEDQWAIEDIEADYAWNYKTDCSQVLIGVIDTGIDYNHEDLINNIWRNTGEVPGNGIDDDANGLIDDYYGWNFYDENNVPMDGHGHGTHVSGIIAAEGGNGKGIAGICWKAKLVALKALNSSGLGVEEDIAEAINYANSLNIDITNNSYGGSDVVNLIAEAIVDAKTAGFIFVAAAGNDGTDNDTSATYPANYASSYDNVISVAASDETGSIASFSNYGDTTVSIIAPGDEIMSTLPGNIYYEFSGTSMAAPMVTGSVAFIWSFDTSMPYGTTRDYIKNNVDAGFATKLIWDGKLNLNQATVDILGL